jgi:hypothetical protein
MGGIINIINLSFYFLVAIFIRDTLRMKNFKILSIFNGSEP